MIKLLLGVFRARKLLDRFSPDIVLGTGGYTSAAVLLAQKLRRGKLVIHEQNAVPGRTNLWLSRWADLVCVSFEESISYFKQKSKTRLVYTGMPVRKEFASLPDKNTARRSLGLDSEMFTLLVVGGSQGARKLNEVAVDMWPLIDDGSNQVMHQTGARNLNDVLSKAEGLSNSECYHITDYLDMRVALASADLVLSRSGASTLAEISAAGLPSLLAPYPFAYADHQRLNANVFCKRRAAIMLSEESLSAASIASVVVKLRNKPSLLASMSKRSSMVFGVGVADKIAAELMTAASI